MQTQDNQRAALFDKVVLGLGILGIVLLAAALGGSYLPKYVPAKVALYLRYAGWVTVGLYVLATAWQNRGWIADVSRQRRARSGANSVAAVAVVLALLGFGNYFGAKYHKRIDVTENKKFSLSDQTKKVLKELKEDLTVTAFVSNNDHRFQGMNRQIKDLWDQYAYLSPRIKFKIVDVDRDPSVARKFEVTRYGTVFIQRGEGKKIEVQGTSEQDATSAILKATQDTQKVVYFVQGHGEADPESHEEPGMGQAKSSLEKQNYQVKKLSLLTEKQVPADAAVVIVAAPKKPFYPQELDKLGAFVKQGGRLYAMLAPQEGDTGFEKWLTKYGVTVRKDVVIDPQQFHPYSGYGEMAPVVHRYPYHETTQRLAATFFPLSRSVSALEQLPEGVSVSPLVETSEFAWGETNLKGQAKQDAADAKGPLKLAMAATLTPPASASPTALVAKESRVVVFGNTSFATNQFILGGGNGDLFLNALNWLTEQSALVSIPSKDTAPKTIDFQNGQVEAVFFTTVAGVPLGLVFLGGFVWWRRRSA